MVPPIGRCFYRASPLSVPAIADIHTGNLKCILELFYTLSRFKQTQKEQQQNGGSSTTNSPRPSARPPPGGDGYAATTAAVDGSRTSVMPSSRWVWWFFSTNRNLFTVTRTVVKTITFASCSMFQLVYIDVHRAYIGLHRARAIYDFSNNWIMILGKLHRII